MYLETCKKIDGSMHPEVNHAKLKELQPNEESQQSWWKSLTGIPAAVSKFFKNPLSSFDKSEFKHLPIVKIYLAQYYEFITGESTLSLNLIEVVDEIVFIIESLMKSYFRYDGSDHFLLNSVVKKVSKLTLYLLYAFSY